jgi:hypothetical protein
MKFKYSHQPKSATSAPVAKSKKCLKSNTWVLISPWPEPTEKKTIESSPFFVRHGSHCRRGDLVGRTTFWLFFFWVPCKSQSLVAVACYLPSRAKDLSAPRYTFGLLDPFTIGYFYDLRTPIATKLSPNVKCTKQFKGTRGRSISAKKA